MWHVIIIYGIQIGCLNVFKNQQRSSHWFSAQLVFQWAILTPSLSSLPTCLPGDIPPFLPLPPYVTKSFPRTKQSIKKPLARPFTQSLLSQRWGMGSG